MDIKYAYYSTSKGYRVVGGTAAHFLKADGSLDNASYVIQSTLNSQLSSYAMLNGVQTFTNTNTFSRSPVIPNGTLGTHAVNLNQLIGILPYSDNWNGHISVSRRTTVSELTWKNYGNGHTIFDISSGTTPWGTSKSNVDADIPWSAAYPTLVGGNGSNTFGVRVDSARIADDSNKLGGLTSGDFIISTYLSSMSSLSNDAISKGIMTNYSPSNDPDKPVGVVDGSLLTLNYSAIWSTQLYGDWRNKDLYFRTQANGTWNKYAKFWHSDNFNPASYITQSVLNTQLSGYATLAGVQTFTNTNTFLQSPVIPAGTLGTHAVNVNQLSTKANGQENATGIGFSSGNIPTTDGNSFPYMYHNSGLYVALATQSYAQTNFLSTPNGTSVIISGSNLNNYLKTGFYRGSGLINAPYNNSGWWHVVIETHDATWVTQTATSFGSGNTANVTYRRTLTGGSWSAWAQVWTSQDFNTTNIQQWNYAYQYGLNLNEEFTTNLNTGLMLSDDYWGGESGIIDNQLKRFLATKKDEYYFYGSDYNKFDGLNFHWDRKLFGMGREANKEDKLTVEGSVKASKNFKSEEERPDTIFIPNGNLAVLNDEIINDESEYAIRLNPHEYVMDSFSLLGIDDRNRLIHIIGQYVKMAVDFKTFYPKQQIVIYNFDQSGGVMEVKIQGKTIYYIDSHCFLRLYVTESLRVIAERQQPCDFIW